MTSEGLHIYICCTRVRTQTMHVVPHLLTTCLPASSLHRSVKERVKNGKNLKKYVIVELFFAETFKIYIYIFFLRKIVKMKCKTLECGDYKWINSINTRHPNGLI